jgi:hypothetical protein
MWRRQSVCANPKSVLIYRRQTDCPATSILRSRQAPTFVVKDGTDKAPMGVLRFSEWS